MSRIEKRIEQLREEDLLSQKRLSEEVARRESEAYQRYLTKYNAELPDRIALRTKLFYELNRQGVVELFVEATGVPVWLWDGTQDLEIDRGPEAGSKKRADLVFQHRAYAVTVMRPSLNDKALIWGDDLKIEAISNTKNYSRPNNWGDEKYSPRVSLTYNEHDQDKILTINGAVTTFSEKLPNTKKQRENLLIEALAQAFYKPFRPERPNVNHRPFDIHTPIGAAI